MTLGIENFIFFLPWDLNQQPSEPQDSVLTTRPSDLNFLV